MYAASIHLDPASISEKGVNCDAGPEHYLAGGSLLVISTQDSVEAPAVHVLVELLNFTNLKFRQSRKPRIGCPIGDAINLRTTGSEPFNATNNLIEPRVLTFTPPKTSIGPVFLITFDISTRCFGRHRPYPHLHHSTGKR
nr:uncharacterized protein LOC121120980 [Lepeophtheirus salmonis]